MKNLILFNIVFSITTFYGCGKGDVLKEVANDALPSSEQSKEEPVYKKSLIKGHEQIVPLEYGEPITASSCTIEDAEGVNITSPCSCNVSGECTVGLTPTGDGSATYTFVVTDGAVESSRETVRAKVNEIVPFISTWRVGDVAYGDGDLSVTLPLKYGFNYDFTVDWGDGNTAEVTSYNDPDIGHTYASDGDYTITITGLVEAWAFNDFGDADKILTVAELGTVGWKSLSTAFFGCDNLTTISGGDTSNVTDMSWMFATTKLATPITTNWDTSKVVRMNEMFFNSEKANPDTSKWDTSNVIDMSRMFSSSDLANPDTSRWNTSNVIDMSFMFHQAEVANPDVSDWDTSSVTDMSWMFYNADAANPNTKTWNTSKVENMGYMFASTDIANPNTSDWDTSAVTDMSSMFSFSKIADPDMSGWNFIGVISLSNMFMGTAISTTNYDALLIQLDATAGSNLTFHAGTSKYTKNSAADTARSNLLSDSWAINDGGSI